MPGNSIENLGQGTYILILRLSRNKEIRIGRLGRHHFPKGFYAYVGSALGPGGLAARIKHHLRKADRPRWHVDYLRDEALPQEVWAREQKIRLEHRWATALQQVRGASIPLSGFGCSDCRCQTHLFHFVKRPSIHAFKKLIQRECENAGPISRYRFTPF